MKLITSIVFGIFAASTLELDLFAAAAFAAAGHWMLCRAMRDES